MAWQPYQLQATNCTSVASAAANTVLVVGQGRLCSVIVTTAGTGTGNVLFFDSATTNSGTIVGVLPATIAVGTLYLFNFPVQLGLVCQNVASGPILTVSWH
jgi:hypothetical protein